MVICMRDPLVLPRAIRALRWLAQGVAHFGFRVARCKSVSILELARQYLITPKQLRR